MAERTLPAPGSAGAWVLAARPKTLTASVTPVVVGSAIAFAGGGFQWLRALGALTVAVGIQIGTNLVNDALDARRGADREGRLGPPRVVNSGLLSFGRTLAGGLACFAIAGCVGLALAAVTSWWVLLPGGIAILSGIAYTAGPAPLAYVGLGEFFVFGFFGLFATVGTAYVQLGSVPPEAWFAGASLGMLAVAILEVNNIRDAPTDAPAGKRTLAVRLGQARSRAAFAVIVAAAYVLAADAALWTTGALFVLPSVVFAIRSVQRVTGGASGVALNKVLSEVARLELVFGLLLAAGLAMPR